MTDRSKPTVRPDNSFEFVTLAAARARQLLRGCIPRVEGSLKPARRALQELSSGAINRADDRTDLPPAK